jgi:hypothetical protein
MADTCSKAIQNVLSPYHDAGLHMNIALSGKVDRLAQRIFADVEEVQKLQLKNVRFSERVFHFLSALALSIPLINLVFQKFLPPFPTANESLTITPRPIIMKDRQEPRPVGRRIGFDKIEVREYDKKFAPSDKEGYVQHSLTDLPDETNVEAQTNPRRPRRVRPEQCSVS